MGDRYSCFLPDYSLKRWYMEVIRIILFVRWISFYKMASELAKSNIRDVISANNVDVNKSLDKMIIPGCNIFPCNMM